MSEYYPFIRWSSPHLIALLMIVLFTLALLVYAKVKGRTTSDKICRGLAIVLAVQLVGEFIWRFYTGDYGSDWRYNLPLHFCSLMIAVACIALWTHKAWACCFCYFGILAGSIQGLITPAMANGYPSLAFFVFFLAHGLLLTVGLAIPILIGWRAGRYDALFALFMMDVYLLCIHPINLALDTNYGYTQFSPVRGCILDYFGPAPWYYLVLQLPVLGLFYLMSLFVARRKS